MCITIEEMSQRCDWFMQYSPFLSREGRIYQIINYNLNCHLKSTSFVLWNYFFTYYLLSWLILSWSTGSQSLEYITATWRNLSNRCLGSIPNLLNSGAQAIEQWGSLELANHWGKLLLFNAPMCIQCTCSVTPTKPPRKSGIWDKTWRTGKSCCLQEAGKGCGKVFQAEEAASTKAYGTREHGLCG